ncbi:MAG: hypothetical protein KatS3mg068_1122 [Candidatus Sericytochromatia bacterium]|nr:MAG: hypothetical protein KatS3mg068_1122 [Candidatus Sericytochromatia bacterium]
MKLVLTLLFIILFISNSYSFSLSPYSVLIQAEKNETAYSEVTLTNDNNFSYQVKSYPMDMDIDNNSKKIYKLPDKANKSFASNIRVFPEEFILKPYESKTVKIFVEKNPDLKGGNKAMVYFEAIPIDNEKNKKVDKILVAMRLGVLVLHEVKNTIVRASRIKNFYVEQKENEIIFYLKIENTGNSYIEPTTFVSIFKDNNFFIGNLEFNKSIVFAGKEKTLNTKLNYKLDKGKYYAIVTYQYDKDKNNKYSKKF